MSIYKQIAGIGFMVILVGFAACKKGAAPKLPETKMVAVLTDVHLAEAAILIADNDRKRDSLAKIYYSEIFQKHQVTKEDFDQSMRIWLKNPTGMKTIYQKVEQNLTTMTK